MVEGVLGHSIHSKGQNVAYSKLGKMSVTRPTPPSPVEPLKMLPDLRGTQRRKELGSRSSTVPAALPLALPLRPRGSADWILLEESVVGEDATRQAPVRAS